MSPLQEPPLPVVDETWLNAVGPYPCLERRNPTTEKLYEQVIGKRSSKVPNSRSPMPAHAVDEESGMPRHTPANCPPPFRQVTDGFNIFQHMWGRREVNGMHKIYKHKHFKGFRPLLKGQHLSLTFCRGHTQTGALAIPNRLDGKGIVLWLRKIILQQQR